MAALSNQIDYCPMVLPALNVIGCQFGKFTPAKSAT